MNHKCRCLETTSPSLQGSQLGLPPLRRSPARRPAKRYRKRFHCRSRWSSTQVAIHGMSNPCASWGGHRGASTDEPGILAWKQSYRAGFLICSWQEKRKIQTWCLFGHVLSNISSFTRNPHDQAVSAVSAWATRLVNRVLFIVFPLTREDIFRQTGPRRGMHHDVRLSGG